MKSHTVPRKLLDQFAYDDPVTKSRRLYRYEKDRPVLRFASARTATRWDGHFADPTNAEKEEELELRLKREFEDPVNDFLETMGDASFSWTDERVRVLTGYIRMLFNRSRARQVASGISAKTKADALRTVLRDEQAINALTNRHIASIIENGLSIPRGRWSPKQDVKQALMRQIAQHTGPDETQRDYIQALETMMSFPDETMLNGGWAILHADPDHPFVIGDAPVVTWERTAHNTLYFGIGFARPNVEVFLPVSPTACICVLPRVERTRKVQRPSPVDVNIAQARFATQHCFTNVCSQELDAILQPHFGKMRMGIDGFNTNHRDASKLLFDILMNVL